MDPRKPDCHLPYSFRLYLWKKDSYQAHAWVQRIWWMLSAMNVCHLIMFWHVRVQHHTMLSIKQSENGRRFISPAQCSIKAVSLAISLKARAVVVHIQ
jgi:hypothetical protein